MKVFHYKHVSDASNYHHTLTSDYGESNTDKTFYRPTLDGVRAGSIGSARTGLYDFPNGVDTGERFQPILRNKGIDIAEVSAILDNITSVITDKKTVDKENLQKKLDEAKAQLEAKKQNEENSTEKILDSNK